MTRTVAEKMRVRAGSRVHLVHAPEDAVRALELPALEVCDDLEGRFDHLFLFCRTRAEMEATVPPLRPHLAGRGALWVAWPRGRGGGSDLTLPVVIEVGYDHGLVESTCLRIDRTWSALRFTHPKPGKTYHNSHGTLRRQPTGR